MNNINLERLDQTVESDAEQATLDEQEQLARQRCPAAYTLSHDVPLVVEVKRA